MHHLAGAVAARTDLGLVSRPRTSPFAGPAGLFLAYFHLTVDAAHGLHERDPDVIAQILALNRRVRITAAPTAPAKAENITEEVVDMGENILTAPRPIVPAAAQPFFAVGVVDAPLLQVAQYFIGLGGLLESGFGLGIALIMIRVMLHGQLAVGLLDCLRRCVFGDAENFVIGLAHTFAL